MPTGRHIYQRIYLSSLAAIVLLVLASLLVIEYIVSEELSMAEVNEFGGRQRKIGRAHV